MQRCVKDRSQAERSTGSQIGHPGRPGSGRAWRRDYNRIMAQVTVRFFARYAELTGCESAAVRVSDSSATVRDVLDRVRETVPGARSLPARPLAALNLRQVKLHACVSDQGEAALLAPLAVGLRH